MAGPWLVGLASRCRGQGPESFPVPPKKTENPPENRGAFLGTRLIGVCRAPHPPIEGQLVEKPTGVGRASLPTHNSTETIWNNLLLQLQPGCFRTVVAIYGQLHQVHLHGITIAVPSCWLPLLGQRRDLLEAAARRATGGRALMVHLTASDAELAGGVE